jgi:hypothetical protein
MNPATIPTTLPWLLHEVHDVEEKLKTGRVLIVGGRGTGKSTILSRVMEVQKGDDLYLGCRDTPTARRRLREDAAAKRQYVSIYLDDLDVLLTAGGNDRHEDLQDLVGCLWTLVQNQKPSGGGLPLVLATTSIEFRGPLAHRLASAIEDGSGANKTIDAISRFRELFGKYRLTPWPKSWDEDWWLKSFLKAFKEQLREPHLTWWAEGILELSGGHIGLWGPAVQKLTRLVEVAGRDAKVAEQVTAPQVEGPPPRDEERLTDFEKQLIGRVDDEANRGTVEGEDIEDAIRRYVEDFLSVEHVLPIRSALRRLRDSRETLELNSYECLVAIARQDSESGTKPPEDVDIRSILQDEGLVMLDPKTGRMRIPGAILERLILQSVVRTQANIELVADPFSPEQGELRIQSAGGMDRVVLVGATWRILSELHRRQGDIVSATELKEAAGLADDKRAVANAIQRLMAKLKPVGQEDLIINVYNRGYRFVLR